MTPPQPGDLQLVAPHARTQVMVINADGQRPLELVREKLRTKLVSLEKRRKDEVKKEERLAEKLGRAPNPLPSKFENEHDDYYNAVAATVEVLEKAEDDVRRGECHERSRAIRWASPQAGPPLKHTTTPARLPVRKACSQQTQHWLWPSRCRTSNR